MEKCPLFLINFNFSNPVPDRHHKCETEVSRRPLAWYNIVQWIHSPPPFPHYQQVKNYGKLQTKLTQQQAIFWFNIACSNHNPDGTDYDKQRFYIHTWPYMYYQHFKNFVRYLGQLLTVQQSNIERTSCVK